MQPKKIRRVTSPIQTRDKNNSFVGIIDGKPTLIDIGSGIEDESMLTGEVDQEGLEALGLSEAEIEGYQHDLDERIDADLFGTSAKAFTISDQEGEDADQEEANQKKSRSFNRVPD